MAASVELSETNGSGSGTRTDGISNINYGSADVVNLVPADHPLVIPTNSGQVRSSFGKFIQFHLIALNGSNKIANLRAYKSAGSYFSTEGIKSFSRGGFDDAQNSGHALPYATPSDQQTSGTIGGSTNTEVWNWYLTNSAGGFGNFSNTIPTTANIPIADTVNDNNVGLEADDTYSDYFYSGTFYTNAQTAGASGSKTITIQYDES